MFRRVVFLSGLLLTTCAAPAPPSPTFDGTYVGESSRVRGGDTCGPATEQVTLAVHGGTFNYGVPATRPDVGNSLVTVNAHLASDGDVAGQTLYSADNPLIPQGMQYAWATVRGRVSAGHIEAMASSLNCARRLSLAGMQTPGAG